jgi:hypothetical protein
MRTIMIRFSQAKGPSLMLALATLIPLIVTGGSPFSSHLPAPELTTVSTGVSAGLA